MSKVTCLVTLSFSNCGNHSETEIIYTSLQKAFHNGLLIIPPHRINHNSLKLRPFKTKHDMSQLEKNTLGKKDKRLYKYISLFSL
jgi:hypothetical protein